MTEIQIFQEVLKHAGSSALIFAIWFFYHKSSSKQMTDIIERNFQLLESLIKSNNDNTILLSEIRTKISDKFVCPYTREFIRDGGAKNE